MVQSGTESIATPTGRFKRSSNLDLQLVHSPAALMNTPIELLSKLEVFSPQMFLVQ